MSSILFITTNQSKLLEVQTLLPGVEGLDLDLPEIQGIDAHKIIAAKLHEARKHYSGTFIVEDTSLYITSLHGLPGPLVKWFLQSVGAEGIYHMARAFGDMAVQAITVIGYYPSDGVVQFFEGIIDGEIVAPRGSEGFGWDAIFQPRGYKKTFAEMTQKERYTCSMRTLAVNHLKKYLIVSNEYAYPS